MVSMKRRMAAKKAWRTRKRKYGKSGMRKSKRKRTKRRRRGRRY